MGRTEHDDDYEEEEEDAGKKKRIDLSVSQVAGAGAATLAAATAASYLNVYGTVVGAAVMATLSTTVSPLLQHWFSRSGEQAKQLAGKAVGHTEVAPSGDPVAPGAPVAPFPEEISESGLLREVSETGTPPSSPSASDTTHTMAMPSLGATGGRPTASGAPVDPTGRIDPSEALPWLSTVGGEAKGAEEPAETDGGTGEAEPVRRGWRSVVIPAVAVFALAMMVILLFELFTGRSLTAWTQGRDEPTLPTLWGGSSSGPPAQESETEAPATTEDTPGTSGRAPQPGVPESGQPTDPGLDPEAPADGGAGGGGTGGPVPPVEPPGEEDPQAPGEQVPDPGTGNDGQGGQGGENTVPAPVPPEG